MLRYRTDLPAAVGRQNAAPENSGFFDDEGGRIKAAQNLDLAALTGFFCRTPDWRGSVQKSGGHRQNCALELVALTARVRGKGAVMATDVIIGTVVLSNAQVKLFVTGHAREARAERRFKKLKL